MNVLAGVVLQLDLEKVSGFGMMSQIVVAAGGGYARIGYISPYTVHRTQLGGDAVPKPNLSTELLKGAAAVFAGIESAHGEPTMYGVTDGKAIGTYLEHKFREYLLKQFTFAEGNSAKGIDFPGLAVDMKTTSIRQPQSSCPYKSARQKVFGLGYAILVLVYEKTDDQTAKTGCLDIEHVVYIEKEQTADFQMTRGLRQILENEGNKDDIIAFMADKNLPVDDIEAGQIADELLTEAPLQGYLTISNALQWRLQYGRVIDKAGNVDGVFRLR